jgi:transglutaminase-like putative cysteine protease
VAWVDHLNILTVTTLFGLVIGVIGAKQRRFPRIAIHGAAIIFGLLLAFWQTAGAYDGGNVTVLANGMRHWFATVMAGGTGEDDSIFLFFITALGFVLAYTSAWLLYRTRSPWLMIVANAVVLLINLSNIDPGYIVFLVVFLIASLLLLLRFNLYESIKRWRRQGLRYADDLGWDVMQAGALISIAILIFSWFMPWGYVNDTASQVWNTDANPWVQVQNTWNRVISLSGGANPANHGNFRDTLVLGGNPNLNNDVVFSFQSDDPSQYLESLSYDTYDGRGWSNGPTASLPIAANTLIPSESSIVHTVKQTVNVVNPPGEQYPYLLGASQIGSSNQPVIVLQSSANNTQVAVLAKNGKMTAGQRYTVVSYVSSADVNSLRALPMPSNSPRFAQSYDGEYPLSYYDPSILATSLQLPKGLDPAILALAQQITAGAPTMYDKVVALESYLRNNFTYSVDIRLPAGEEGTSWFLFRSGRKGFCNYFSTAMTVMARLLGIPARVVAGYTNGQYDAKRRAQVVYGTDAHSWTQVYFAGYGWVNFEPSAGFAAFNRPAPNQYNSSNPNLFPTVPIGTNKGNKNRDLTGPNVDVPGGSISVQTAAQEAARLRQQITVATGSIVLFILFCLILFSIWWRRLFRNHRLAAQLYGRMTVLANWAGIEILPSQTPYEYVGTLALATPEEAPTLERFGDIYVRDIWADPESPDHPSRSGEINELPSLWKRLQPRLFLYVLRHPHILWVLPARLWAALVRLRTRRRAERDLHQDW